MRLDQASPRVIDHPDSGIHPLSPGFTPLQRVRDRRRAGYRSGVEFSCVAFREGFQPFGRIHDPVRAIPVISRAHRDRRAARRLSPSANFSSSRTSGAAQFAPLMLESQHREGDGTAREAEFTRREPIMDTTRRNNSGNDRQSTVHVTRSQPGCSRRPHGRTYDRRRHSTPPVP